MNLHMHMHMFMCMCMCMHMCTCACRWSKGSDGGHPASAPCMAEPPIGAPTRIVTAFLAPSNGSGTHSGGAFAFATGHTVLHERAAAARANVLTMHQLVDDFVARSPGLCRPDVTLHVMHNLGRISRRNSSRVKYHFFEPGAAPPDMPAINARFLLMISLLQRLPWECAFSLDLTDVSVLHLPACVTLPKSKLAIGSSGTSPRISAWIKKRGERSGMNASWDDSYPGFRKFLDAGAGSKVGAPMTLNAGIVGGRRAVLEPALLQVRARLLSNLRTRARPVLYWGEDMVAWNELTFDKAVLTGYPYGPVNLPMYGRRLAFDKPDGTAAQWHSSRRRHFWFAGWLKVPSTLFEDTAPSAFTVAPRPQAAPTHRGAPPEQIWSLPWSQQSRLRPSQI